MANLPSSARRTIRLAKQSPQTPNMNRGFLSSPQASDFLPSISPTIAYSTAHAVWTSQELHTLHTGLTQFPVHHFDNVTRYIKIAATLPRKCVRDVAFKVKTLDCISDQSTSGTKRTKIEPYQTSNQQSSAELEETRLAALLQDNLLAINTMRTNLLNGKADENRSQMLKFRENCEVVLSTLSGICTSIPPLPLQLDTSLLDEDNEDSNSKNQ